MSKRPSEKTLKTTIRRLRHGDPIPEGKPRRYKASNGYMRLRWRVGPYELVECFEHRFVMGMPPEHLHVHHINHDKADNRAENLRLLTSVQHGQEHATIDADKAQRLYATGISIPEVGRRMGHDNATIYRALVRLGVTIRPGRTYNVRTDVADEDVRGLYAAGVSARRIAAVLGCSPTAVDTRIKALGLPTRRTGRMSRDEEARAEEAIARFLEERAA